jgi:hypothetical protein
MNQDDPIEKELRRLYDERSNLIRAYQEMAEAARRLQEGFYNTIKEHKLRLTYHRYPLNFYEDTKKKCDEMLKDIL